MSVRRRWVIAGAALAVVVLGAAAAGWAVSRWREPDWRGMAVSPPYPAADFVLTDQHGRPFQLSSQRGRAVLLFFGYTFCPDVCPATMLQYRQVREALGADAGRVTFAFVSVDPERDDPPRLAAYLAHFDPTIVGLTGSPQAIEEVAARYGVFYEKVAVANSATGYLVNHTALTYLVGPDGLVRVAFPYGVATDDMVHDVRQVLRLASAPVTAAVRVEGAWARPAAAAAMSDPAMGATGAVYMRLTNLAGRPDRLVEVRTDVAAAAEIHRTSMEGHVMHMQPAAGIDLPPGVPVALEPGGLHVMLLGLTRDLEVGQRFRIVLVFEQAGELPVDVEVRTSAP